MENTYRVSYEKTNNTILFKRKMKITDGDEKGERAKWQWWYEVDMDDASEERFREWVDHINEKNWAIENPKLMSEFTEIYRTFLNNIKDENL